MCQVHGFFLCFKYFFIYFLFKFHIDKNVAFYKIQAQEKKVTATGLYNQPIAVIENAYSDSPTLRDKIIFGLL